MIKLTKKTFFITTAIDYPSSKPHLGHAYEKIGADIIARFKRLRGYDVFFSTGTDEHGLKIQRAAEKAGKTPKEFVDEMTAHFKELCRKLNISYDDFIRTTDERHREAVEDILERIKDDVYKGEYSGLYCVDCETFYTENESDGKCPVHKKKLETVTEESYFFRMGKYQKEIIKHIEKGLTWPETKRNEILKRLEEPLKDLSITRTSFQWGIKLPQDRKHVLYVWIDALTNYLTTIGYPDKRYKKYWPADIHIIGKDIAWHHNVIWSAILLSAKLELPKKIFSHGFVTLGGEKLSKARAVIVDPIELIDKYSADALRYFLYSEVPFGEDGDFSEASLIARNNNELVANYGNLFYRVTYFITKNFEGKIPEGKLGEEEKELQKKLKETVKKVEENVDELKLHEALKHIMELSGDVNKYFQEKKPWADENPGTTLYTSANMLRGITILLYPFIPESAEKALNALGVKEITLEEIDKFSLKPGHKIKAEILFKKIEEIKEKEKKKEEHNMVTMDEFSKMDLRVATILDAQDHPNASKLYVMQVDLGSEKRQIVAGLKGIYNKEELKGKRIVMIINLEPAKLRGVESRGMLLAAGDGVLITPEKDVPNGAKVV